MIISNEEAAVRLNSPLNLINRLRSSGNRKSSMNLFIPQNGKSAEAAPKIEEVKQDFNPFKASNVTALSLPSSPSIPSTPQQPASITSSEMHGETVNLDKLLTNSDTHIKLGLAHDRALSVLTNALDQLSSKMDDVKTDRLPAVITAATKTVESIRKERSEASKNSRDREVHYHFYTPVQRKIEDYEVIDVTQ